MATPLAVVALAPSPIAIALLAAAVMDAFGPMAIELVALAPVLSSFGISVDLIEIYL